MGTANRLSMVEWFLVLLAVMAVGLVCMKGFGSRTDY
jgi:hypothetical protein